MKSHLSTASRIFACIAAAALLAVLFVPLWSIELNAPQYPEGLNLEIHANGLRGNVEIINGLNHYIGMKTLHNEDFPEFTILPYCIVAFVLLFALVALLNRRKWLHLALGLFVAFGIIAMADFWRWEYNYGHNLNPNAAIIVPGMSYQPPLIGFKQLLNFGAYSIPDIGGWIFIGAGILLLLGVIIENHNGKKKPVVAPVVTAFLIIIGFSSCHNEPVAINTGKDNCYFCKMTISDPKFGAEIISQKGKIYKFDDIHCLLSFIQSKELKEVSANDIYLVDYAGDHQLVMVGSCYLLKGDAINGPMNGHVIAFRNRDSLSERTVDFKAETLSWEQLSK